MLPNPQGAGSIVVRPVFLGNLDFNVRTEDIEDMFWKPVLESGLLDGGSGIPVERVDLKRGFGFVFLNDAKTEGDKERIERYVREISGMYVFICLSIIGGFEFDCLCVFDCYYDWILLIFQMHWNAIRMDWIQRLSRILFITHPVYMSSRTQIQ